MILRIKMLGKGTTDDPYRVNLPTYAHRHGNITHGWALVEVPVDVHGLSVKELAHETVEKTTEGDFYPELCATCVDKLHANLDEKYQEHRGKFRVELVK
jgi:hypothetical protein